MQEKNILLLITVVVVILGHEIFKIFIFVPFSKWKANPYSRLSVFETKIDSTRYTLFFEESTAACFTVYEPNDTFRHCHQYGVMLMCFCSLLVARWLKINFGCKSDWSNI